MIAVTRTVTCQWCKSPIRLTAWESEWQRWDAVRPMVQVCFPDMSADDREMLISQTCGKCWDEIFSE